MSLIQLLVAGILFLSRVHGVRSSVHPELAASLSQSALTPATSVEDRHSKHEADGGVQPRICFMFSSNTDRKK